MIARFQAERQALAMMDHPNIAKVLDAGAFYVTECNTQLALHDRRCCAVEVNSDGSAGNRTVLGAGALYARRPGF